MTEPRAVPRRDRRQSLCPACGARGVPVCSTLDNGIQTLALRCSNCPNAWSFDVQRYDWRVVQRHQPHVQSANVLALWRHADAMMNQSA